MTTPSITAEQARKANVQAAQVANACLVLSHGTDDENDRDEYISHMMQHLHRLAAALGFKFVKE